MTLDKLPNEFLLAKSPTPLETLQQMIVQDIWCQCNYP